MFLTRLRARRHLVPRRPDRRLRDGITVWTGFGADTVHVDATHYRAGVNEITSLNTGLGNDNVDIHLSAGVDGGFVVNGQGPYQHQLFLTTPVSTGDYNTAPDGVSVTVDGQPLTAGQFVVEPGAAAVVGLVVDPPSGSLADVAVTRNTVQQFTLGASRQVTLGALPQPLSAGDSVTVTVNGVAVAAHVDLASGVVTFPNDATIPVGGLVLIAISQVVHQQFALPQVSGSDNDTIDASGSTLPITIFGGQGSDTITAGTGGDIVFGDRGRVLYFDPSTVLPAIPLDGPSFAQLLQLESLASAVYGSGGPGDHTNGSGRLVGLAVSVDPAIGANDQISVPLGNDIVFGGAGSDTIGLGAGTNLVFGDSGYATWALSADGSTSEIATAASIAPSIGGSDTITTGAGSNVIVGGAGGDQISLGSGTNIVLGDSGAITADPFSGPHFGGLPIVLSSIETTAPGIGGSTTSRPAPATRSSSAAPAPTRSRPGAARTSSSATTAGSTGRRRTACRSSSTRSRPRRATAPPTRSRSAPARTSSSPARAATPSPAAPTRTSSSATAARSSASRTTRCRSARSRSPSGSSRRSRRASAATTRSRSGRAPRS